MWLMESHDPSALRASIIYDIANLIETKCLELQLDMNLCQGQGYDGAGNMAGCCNGAAKIISTKYVIN